MAKPTIILHHVSWDEVREDTERLVAKMQNKGLKFHTIVGIARGGLIPATLVAQHLHIHLIETICIQTYKDAGSTSGAGVLKPFNTSDGGEGVLVVDDLTDSGLTTMYVRKMLPKAHFAVLYAKPEGQRLVDTFVGEVPQETWLVFPWEDPNVAPEDCIRI